MTLAAGTKLGPYEILAAIGAGGMGEVYRARDERLKRDVAIKVLPATYSSDADRLRRFEQEAQAAGALNHPNITAVHDIGSHENAPYIVQELLEGETLRSRLSGGAFTPRRAIGHALQIASGLAAAHGRGIVHRDLKPENIFVTSDGRVKILDFGLAKLTQPEGVGSNATSLPTAAPGTEPGLVMGTVGYMSPEQVRGKFIDARSDIFSFGTILYEMLSGKRAFHGDTAADTMSAILTKEPPDLSETNRRVPEALERIVRHCLEKSPEARFQSASDIAFDLEAMSATPLPSGAEAISTKKARRLLAPAAALAVVLAAFAAGHFLWRSAAAPLPSFKRVTFRRGNLANARFTPDSNSVVYAASWDGSPLEVFTARLDGLESTPLGLLNADVLSVSRSGELAISIREKFLMGPFGVGTLARVPLTGGVPRQVLRLVEYADWAPDGKNLAITRSEAGQTLLEYPIGTALYKSSSGLFSPRLSPEEGRIAVIETGYQGQAILVLNLRGEVRRLATNLHANRLAWAPRGKEIWFDEFAGSGQSAISAVDLDGRRRVVARIPAGLTLFDISADGRVLLERFAGISPTVCRAPGSTQERDLSWFDGSSPVALSANGQLLLLQVNGDAGGSTAQSFYLRRTDGSPPVKLGDGMALDLSPDGRQVLAKSEASGGLSLVPTGPGSPVPLARGGLQTIDTGAFLPDGNRFVVLGRESEKSPRLVYYQEGPDKLPRPLATTHILGRLRASPDGRSVLAVRDFNDDLYLLPIDRGNPRTVPNTRGLAPIAWNPDGASFFAYGFGQNPLPVFKVDATTGQRVRWIEINPADQTGLNNLGEVVMTPDGKVYAYRYDRSTSSDLYVVEGLK